jgi:flagellar hook protein FlgE
MTSLTSFSKALDVISDNVANLNTPGFKASDLFFSSLPNASPSLGNMPESSGANNIGSGTTVSGGGRRFDQGELRETGSATNLAIDGKGFFILSGPSGETIYTRWGQFELDEQGRMIDRETRAVLQGFSDGRLVDVVIDSAAVRPSSSSTRVSFTGLLSTGQPAETPYKLESIPIVDADGERRLFTAEFQNNTAVTDGSWLVKIRDSDQAVVAEGELRFGPGGAPIPEFSSILAKIPANSGAEIEVELNFGSPGTFDGVTSGSGASSSLQIGSADGTVAGRLSDFSFDSAGQLTLVFSNGETQAGPRVALASFSDPQKLESENGTRFTDPAGGMASLGFAGEGGFGRIAPRSLELANVELAREFADIIILQRGFQASSQILNVSSELIQDMYNAVSGRR